LDFYVDHAEGALVIPILPYPRAVRG